MTLATLLRARLDRPSRSINARVLQIVFSLFAPLIVGFAIPAFYVHQNERDHNTKSAIATARALTSAVNLVQCNKVFTTTRRDHRHGRTRERNSTGFHTRPRAW